MNAPLNPGQLLPQGDVSLDDKYTLEQGRAFITGTQTLIRLPMLQRQRDAKAGLHTAGYITGYRGSPQGTVDIIEHRTRCPARCFAVDFLFYKSG